MDKIAQTALTSLLSQIGLDAADAGAIDGAVNGVGWVARGVGSILRLSQSGYIRSYAAWVLAGSIIVIAWTGLTHAGVVKFVMEGLGR